MLSLNDEYDFNVESGVSVVKFGATWCGPCKKMEPTLIQLSSEFNMINFISVDVDQIPALAKKYKIKTVPTMIVLRDGLEINRVLGMSLIEPLRKILKEALQITE